MAKKSLYRRFLPAIISPLVLLILLANMASFLILYFNEQKAAGAAADMNRIYVRETDQSLRAIKEYLYLMGRTDSALSDIRSSSDWVRVSGGRTVMNRLKNAVANFALMDLVFVFDSEGSEYLYAYGQESLPRERTEMKEYVIAQLTDSEKTSIEDESWRVVYIQDTPFLLWVMPKTSSSIYLGVWVRMEKIEEPLRKLSADTSSMTVVTDGNLVPVTHREFFETEKIVLEAEGETTYHTGRTNRYWVQVDQSEEAPYYLCLITPRTLFSGLGSWLIYSLIVLSVLAIVLIPVLLKLIRNDVLEPLRTMDEAIDHIHQGDADYQIEPREDPQEFVRMYDAFNEMTRDLKKSRIRAYEDVIEKQKLRLRYLQMQIRPHFFMNALTTVSNFSRLGKQGELDQFIGYLARYLRYMFRSNLTLVPLKDEIRHIETYLSMQELQFSGTLSHEFDIREEAEEVLIPPFTVHNFAENVVKHAMADQDHVTLYVRAWTEPAGASSETVHIVVEDNGKGLSEDALRQLNDLDYEPKDGQSIGIWNTRQTLRLIYETPDENTGSASIRISSSELGGAKVEIVIPVRGGEQWNEDSVL